jgi:hypothetical protein
MLKVSFAFLCIQLTNINIFVIVPWCSR